MTKSEKKQIVCVGTHTICKVSIKKDCKTMKKKRKNKRPKRYHKKRNGERMGWLKSQIHY